MRLSSEVGSQQHGPAYCVEPPRGAVAARLLRAQEAERAWVARELRDEIGQLAAAVRLNLQQLIDELALSAQAPRARETALIVEYIVRQVRDLATELRPSLLDDLGLGPALSWYVDRQALRHGLQASLVIGEELGPLPEDLAVGCYRIAQEAVGNLVRHARAARCWVVLQRRGESLHLIVSDDGVGFEVPGAVRRAAEGHTLGLQAMAERAAALGGRLLIESHPGGGTEVIVNLPIQGAANQVGEERAS